MCLINQVNKDTPPKDFDSVGTIQTSTPTIENYDGKHYSLCVCETAFHTLPSINTFCRPIHVGVGNTKDHILIVIIIHWSMSSFDIVRPSNIRMLIDHQYVDLTQFKK